MVGHPPILFVAPVEQGRIGVPAEIPHALGDQVEPGREIPAAAVERHVHTVAAIGHDADEIPRRRAGPRDDARPLLVREELHLDVFADHAAKPGDGRAEIRSRGRALLIVTERRVELFTAQGPAARSTQGLDAPPSAATEAKALNPEPVKSLTRSTSSMP
jgi:hypothetical protein